jgi:fibronectin-binding autotransporter adhesin
MNYYSKLVARLCFPSQARWRVAGRAAAIARSIVVAAAAVIVAAPAHAGLIAYWNFDGTSTAAYSDVTGNGFNMSVWQGIFNGTTRVVGPAQAPATTTGPLGGDQALSFTFTGSISSTNGGVNLMTDGMGARAWTWDRYMNYYGVINGTCTISAWLNPSVVGTSTTTYAFGQSTSWGSEYGRPAPDQAWLSFGLVNGQFAQVGGSGSASVGGVGSVGAYGPGSVAVNPNQWYHVVAVRTGNGTAGTMQVYVDGVAGSLVNYNDPTVAPSPQPAYQVAIGATVRGWWPPVPVGNWQGEIDDLAVWNTALSPGKIGAIYNVNQTNGLQDYNAGAINTLFNVYDAGGAVATVLSSTAGRVAWSYCTGLTGTLGSVSSTAGNYYLQLGDTDGLLGHRVTVQTWTGAGGNLNFATATNWNGDAPFNPGDELVFTGTGQTLTNDLPANSLLSAITFTSTAGAFTLGGSAVFIGDSVVNNSPLTQTINFPLLLWLASTGARITSTTVYSPTYATNYYLNPTAPPANTIGGSGSTVVNGLVSGPGGLAVAGSGTVTLANTGNTYAGGTMLAGGTLSISADSALGDASGPLAFTGTAALRVTTAMALGTARAVTIASGAVATLDNQGNAVTAANVISGGGGLTSAGTGTLTLAGANGFSGVTTVNAGTLLLANPGALQSSTFDTIGAGTLSFGTLTSVSLGGLRGSRDLVLANASGTALTLSVGGGNYAGVLSGSGSLNLGGGDTLVLSGSNTFTGPTYGFGSGSLILNNRLALQNTTLAYDQGQQGALLQFGSGVTAVEFGGLAGTSYGDYNDLYLETNTDRGSGQILPTASSEPVTLTVGRNGQNTEFDGSIRGRGKLVKTGSGTLTLNNAWAYDANDSTGSSYTGGTEIRQGTLVVTHGDTDPTYPCDIGLATASNVLTFSGTAATLRAATSLTLGAARPVQIGTGEPGAATAVFDTQGNDLTLAGTISGTGNLTKQGLGNLMLSAANTFRGVTTINGGTLTVADSQALQNTTFDPSGGGTLAFTVAAATLGGLQGSGSLNFGVSLSVGNNNSDTTFSGTMGGTGTLFKVGSGTLVLSNAFNSQSLTVLSSGELSISTEDNLGGATVVAFNGGLLRVTGTAMTGFSSSRSAVVNWNSFNGGFDIADPGNTFTISAVVYGSGSLIKTGSGKLVLAVGADLTGSATVQAGVLKFGDGSYPSIGVLNASLGSILDMGGSQLTIGNGDASSTLAGAITGAGGSLTINGTGMTVISGSNNFLSPTALAGNGTLSLANSQALSMSTLDYGSGGGSLSFSSLTTATLGGLSGTNYHGISFDNRLSLVNAGGTAVTLRIGNNNADTVFSGDILGSGSLVKIGGGTLTLSGTNSYTGGTTVFGGVLDIASITALPSNTMLGIANTAEVVFATDLGSAIQLNLMLPGAGSDPGMTYFRIASSAPASVPEPGTLLLLAAAALAGVAARRRGRKIAE